MKQTFAAHTFRSRTFKTGSLSGALVPQLESRFRFRFAPVLQQFEFARAVSTFTFVKHDMEIRFGVRK